jgi:hypothetical protein
MPVLVGTNVIIDVLTDDRRWADWSVEQLEANAGSGLIVNPMVYAELCFGSPSIEFVDGVVRRFAFPYQEIPRQGLFWAAKAFAQYKGKKGAKTSVLPDFFIGGHARANRYIKGPRVTGKGIACCGRRAYATRRSGIARHGLTANIYPFIRCRSHVGMRTRLGRLPDTSRTSRADDEDSRPGGSPDSGHQYPLHDQHPGLVLPHHQLCRYIKQRGYHHHVRRCDP